MCVALWTIRDGRYDLADFFYKVAYREGLIGHWQVLSPVTPPVASERGEFEVVPAASPATQGGVESRIMDLHGHSLPLAHAAVRCQYLLCLVVTVL